MDVEVKQIAEIVEAREKQFEEMARAMCDGCRPYSYGCKQNLCDSIVSSAETLYCAGYRKQIEGEWKIVYRNKNATVYECTVCGHLYFATSDYCVCGARMKEKE